MEKIRWLDKIAPSYLHNNGKHRPVNNPSHHKTSSLFFSDGFNTFEDLKSKQMSKYGLHGKLTATEGNRDKLAEILKKAAELVSTAKGCHVYAVSIDQNDNNSVWVTEIWDSIEDHDNSLKVEGVIGLISQAMPILAGKPEKGQELDVLGGKY